MPKTVTCPTCQDQVKVPANAEPGDTLVCQGCYEEFTPPHLRKRAYDPEEEESYDVGRVQKDPERQEKRRKAKAIMREGRESYRGERKSARKPFFGMLEVVILVFSVVVMCALGLGYVVAKRWPTIGEGALVVFAYCGMFLFFGIKMIRGRTRIGG